MIFLVRAVINENIQLSSWSKISVSKKMLRDQIWEKMTPLSAEIFPKGLVDDRGLSGMLM